MSEDTAFLPFPPAITHEAVRGATTAYPADYLIEHILKLSNYLIDLTNSSMLFGRVGSDPYSPSLHTLLVRLQNKQLAPSRLPAGFLTAEHIHSQIRRRADQDAAKRPLADYEDLYYALMARMQEIYQLLNLRIGSGFNVASQAVCEDGPSLAELYASLTEYWNVLNNPACGKALDTAIRDARVQALRDEVVRQVEKDNMSIQEAQEQLAQLYSPEVYDGIVGLHFVQDWAPAMVGAYLEQKYRQMLDLEKQDAAAKARTQRRLAKMKSSKSLLTGTSTALAIAERSRAQGIKKPVRQASTKTRRRSRSPTFTQETLTQLHSDKQAEQPSLHHSPEYQPQLHHGIHHKEHSAAIYNNNPNSQEDIERERARQEDLHMVLQWKMKTQRVSEYSNYLRARASEDAQHVVQGTRRTTDTAGGSGDGNAGSAGVLREDGDVSGDMEF